MFPIFLACIFILFLYILKKIWDYRNFRKIINKIPGSEEKGWLRGNLVEFVNGRTETLDNFFKKYGSIFRIWIGPSPWIVVSDPEDVKQILTNKGDCYEMPLRINLELFIGNGLLRSRGEFWKRQRKLLNPLFSIPNLRILQPTMVEITRRLIEKWNAKLQSGDLVLDMFHEMQNLTLDIIGKCAFGLEFDFLNDKLMPPEQKKIFSEFIDFLSSNEPNQIFSMLTISFPILNKIPSKFRNEARRKINNLDTLSKQIIQKRRASTDNQKDLLGILVHTKVEGESMSDEQICDEMRTFLLAGHETTSSTLQWALYHLSKNPEVVKKITEEVNSVIGDRDPTYDDISQLRYISMVINETMRVNPTVPILARASVKENTIHGYTIPKGVFILTPPWLVHHNPEVWANPETFDPMRWKERDSEANPYSFFPFSSGPRACIGKHFSLIETKIAIAMIFRSFTFELKEEKIVPRVSVTMRPSSLKMRVIPRLKDVK
jgi:cytochrome P450